MIALTLNKPIEKQIMDNYPGINQSDHSGVFFALIKTCDLLREKLIKQDELIDNLNDQLEDVRTELDKMRSVH